MKEYLILLEIQTWYFIKRKHFILHLNPDNDIC